jgi:hypothetical protein
MVVENARLHNSLSRGNYVMVKKGQQAILDQIDRALEAADPQRQSSYAAFSRRTRGAPYPAAEVIAAQAADVERPGTSRIGGVLGRI